MKNSRDLNDLLPGVKERAIAHLALCRNEGIDVIVTSTERDAESQSALYAQGRELVDGIWKVVDRKRVVTNAKAGFSWHNWKVAYDVVPLRNGKAVWGTTGEDLVLWTRVGELGERCGLEWAGRWKTFREFPHFQFTAGYSIADFQAGNWDMNLFI